VTRIPFEKLPPVPGFTRVADAYDERGRYAGRRLRCDLCGDVIPSLGVGYHRNGRPCVERKAERERRAAARPVRFERLTVRPGELLPGDRIVEVDGVTLRDGLPVVEHERNDQHSEKVTVDDRWPIRYLEHGTPVTVERRAA